MSRYTTISSATHTATDQVMSAEQFEQVVKAIAEGKYSWACVLILRCAGYNPVHYLPYRTYKRLIKENRLQPTKLQNHRLSETEVGPKQVPCMAARQ